MIKIPNFVHEAVEASARAWGVEPGQVLQMGETTRSVTNARREAWRVLRQHTDDRGRPAHTYAKIAKWFGADAASVCRGVR